MDVTEAVTLKYFPNIFGYFSGLVPRRFFMPITFHCNFDIVVAEIFIIQNTFDGIFICAGLSGCVLLVPLIFFYIFEGNLIFL